MHPKIKKDIVKGECNPSPKFKALSVISTKEFKKATKNDIIVYALMAKESSEQTMEIPQEVDLIFREFQDVFPNDLPNSLPSIHDIQHMINLIPGVTLRNLQLYRMIPTKHAELNR